MALKKTTKKVAKKVVKKVAKKVAVAEPTTTTTTAAEQKPDLAQLLDTTLQYCEAFRWRFILPSDTTQEEFTTVAITPSCRIVCAVEDRMLTIDKKITVLNIREINQFGASVASLIDGAAGTLELNGNVWSIQAQYSDARFEFELLNFQPVFK